ncbi:ROK family transcriptional regulator [Actinospica sp. MGRD01-02]|uniref:ROK family transcriptional regulator n=1 Tax=Actinospica acidithermotolerans TaxID=2828514 RepID=A0A941IJI5_9ACTN|nr:ROK family transcriptional regulator [Actinospica acidithermotolerans]MBR7829499.1 ROK family transcriptional regulator [Actinospica acidithermotolerans]
MTTTRTPDETSRPWSSRTLRVNNERVLLERLRLSGAASRAELARVTGISKPTVSAALGNLEAAGLVRETGEMAVTAGRGRSAVLYEVNPTAGHVVGIDIGRSRIRVALADLEGTIRGRREVPNDVDGAAGPEPIVATATQSAREVVAEAGLDWSQVVHTVVGTPGVFDPASNEVRYAGSLPGWGRTGVVDSLRRELGESLSVHNDANLAAFGEYVFGAGRDCPLLVFLMVGTGIGAGIVVDGKLFAGASGAAGEVGYLPFPASAPYAGTQATQQTSTEPGSGTTEPFYQRGMLDAAVGGSAVTALAAAAGMRVSGGPKEVFDAARAGNAAALDAVRGEATRLAHAVAAIAAMLDPALIVLGGGVGDNADLLLDPIYESLAALTPLRPPIVPAALGGDAVLIGAIATALGTARELVFEGRL